MIHRHQLTCAQFLDLADAYALGTLEELERHACARHLARTIHHHGCREALTLIEGLGMQGSGWDKMTARHLYHIVRALDQAGLNAEARMIAAEAVARG